MSVGPVQIIAIVLIVLLLFGTRLPSVMRSMGLGIKEFKKGIRDDDEGSENLSDSDSSSKSSDSSEG